MAGELRGVVEDMFRAFETMDVDAAVAGSAEDVQGIDEISRRWMRGRDELAGYFKQIAGEISDVRSEMHDVHETMWGDAGLVTFWLEQDYTLQGQTQHISAPSTAVLRKEGGSWKLVLFHSAPLPESPA